MVRTAEAIRFSQAARSRELALRREMVDLAEEKFSVVEHEVVR